MQKITFKLMVMFVAIGIIITGCGSTKSASSNDSNISKTLRTVKIGYVDSGKSFPSDALGIAIEKGYIADELKKVNAIAQFIPFVGAGPAINEALASNSLDLGNLGDVPSIIAKSAGTDTKLISVQASINDAALIVPTGSQITSIQQLKGKKVATQKGAYMHRTLLEMLKANGMTVNDIQFINMTGVDAASAIVSKSVDAAVLPNTSEAKIILEKKGIGILDCKDHPEWKGSNGLVVRSDYAKSNADILEGVLKGLKKATDYSNQNPDEAKTILTKSGFSKEVFDYLYPTNLNFGTGVSDQAIQSYSNVNTFLVNNGLTKKSVDVKTWVDNSYYENAVK